MRAVNTSVVIPTTPSSMGRFKDISPAMANLVGRLCGTLLYGVQIVVFSGCVYILLQRRSLGRNNSMFLLTLATLEFLVSTIHVADSWRMLIEAFIWKANIPGASFSYWILDPSKPTEIITKTLPIVNSIFADVTLIWRLYIVWGSNWTICVLPCISVVAYAITYFIGTAKLAVLTGDDFFVISQYAVAGIIMSAITHITVTCLIAGKIWRTIHRGPEAYRYSKGSMSAFWTVIESGALYSTAAILLAILAALKTQAGGLFTDIFVQLSAIIPSLVVIRAGLGLTFGAKNTTSIPPSIELSNRNEETNSSLGTFTALAPATRTKQEESVMSGVESIPSHNYGM